MPELFDLYGANRRLTGARCERGSPMPAGCYHLVAEAVVRSEQGELLLTKRHPAKPFGGLWECTAGSVLAGEDSLHGAVRELFEETGLRADPREAIPLCTEMGKDYFRDTFLFLRSAEPIILQEGETVDACWAGPDRLAEMLLRGEIVPLLKPVLELALRFDGAAP